MLEIYQTIWEALKCVELSIIGSFQIQIQRVRLQETIVGSICCIFVVRRPQFYWHIVEVVIAVLHMLQISSIP